jgi:hypothetical protein
MMWFGPALNQLRHRGSAGDKPCLMIQCHMYGSGEHTHYLDRGIHQIKALSGMGGSHLTNATGLSVSKESVQLPRRQIY